MKKLLILVIVIAALVIVAFQIWPVKQSVIAIVTKPNHLVESGKTIKNRVKVPEGYKRVSYDSMSFQHFIRYQKLKSFGSKVINYDGELYFYQLGHVGVLDVDVPSNGLQQFADALIRLRSEYLW